MSVRCKSDQSVVGSITGTGSPVSGASSVPGEQRTTPTTPCFASGTLIKTLTGEKPVEDIRVGDEVLTRDNGYQSVIWQGARALPQEAVSASPELRPVRIAAGALGPGVPERDLLVSPEHRMMLRNRQIRQWFGTDEVLIAARHLTCFPGISRAEAAPVTYVHIMCGQHEIVLAEGCWSESFQVAENGDTPEERASQRAELLSLFPELQHMPCFGPARPVIAAEEFARASGIAAE